MSSLAEIFREAEKHYRRVGWAAIPLENDSNGFPKKPFMPNWQVHSPHGKPVAAELWERAKGIGLVLGQVSGGLCAIDVDDAELASVLSQLCPWTRHVRTIRNRGHFYFMAEQPGESRRFQVEYDGRQVGIELKSTGTQVAAPPTPGYVRLSVRDVQPWRVDTLAAAWEKLAALVAIKGPGVETSGSQILPWAPMVPQQQRNNTLYIEAHKLREARIPVDQALELLRHRWEHHYATGNMTWRECEATIRSAYHKPIPGGINGRDAYRIWTGWNAGDESRSPGNPADNGPQHPP